MAEPFSPPEDAAALNDGAMGNLGGAQETSEESFSPSLSEVQGTGSWYPHNELSVRYEFHPGVQIQQPAGATGPGEVVRIHSEYWTKSVEYDFNRMNEWPVCPHWETGDPNEVLTYATINLAKPAQGPENVRIFACAGRYVYRLLSPMAGLGPLPTGTSPESTATQADNTMPGAYFDRTMLQTMGYTVVVTQ